MSWVDKISKFRKFAPNSLYNPPHAISFANPNSPHGIYRTVPAQHPSPILSASAGPTSILLRRRHLTPGGDLARRIHLTPSGGAADLALAVSELLAPGGARAHGAQLLTRGGACMHGVVPERRSCSRSTERRSSRPGCRSVSRPAELARRRSGTREEAARALKHAIGEPWKRAIRGLPLDLGGGNGGRRPVSSIHGEGGWISNGSVWCSAPFGGGTRKKKGCWRF